MQTVPKRSDIAIEHTWNAESVFPAIDDWETEFGRAGGRISELARFRGRQDAFWEGRRAPGGIVLAEGGHDALRQSIVALLILKNEHHDQGNDQGFLATDFVS